MGSMSSSKKRYETRQFVVRYHDTQILAVISGRHTAASPEAGFQRPCSWIPAPRCTRFRNEQIGSCGHHILLSRSSGGRESDAGSGEIGGGNGWSGEGGRRRASSARDMRGGRA